MKFKENLKQHFRLPEKLFFKTRAIHSRMKQMKLFSENIAREFGGSLSKNTGKRKVKRPLVFSKPMHLVLKTSKARGRFAFSPTDLRIKALIQRMGTKFNVKIYSSAQNWSHIHLVVRFRDRNSYRAFIRALTAAMVLKLKASKGFFDLSPYTKVASWGKQFRNLTAYALKNQMQARGLTYKRISKDKKQSLTNNKDSRGRKTTGRTTDSTNLL